MSQRFEQQQQELKMLAANLEQMTKQIDEIDQNLQAVWLLDCCHACCSASDKHSTIC
jgi:dsDNA-specific endonuclease/ATPase MutS2